MDKRKLIKFGKNSYVISLPKEWVEENKLDKGSEINLNKFGENLVISSEANVLTIDKSITLNCEGKDFTLIKRLILSSYINNFSTITVKNFMQEQSEGIRKVIKNLFAVEMLEESKNKIIIKDILDVTDISLYEIIRRTDHIIKSMFADSLNCFENAPEDNISVRDDDVNRLSYLALKVVRRSLDDRDVAKILKLKSSDILHIWELIARIENIGDSIKRISEIAINLKTSKDSKERLMDFYASLKTDFVNVMKCYYTDDEKLVYELLSKSADKRIKIFELNSLSKEIEFSAIIEQLHNIHESIKNIARSSVNTYLMKQHGI